MVSKRSIKSKFVDGERVLCYEPDPTKAKVLYDSKVREVVIRKDQRGRKSVEYLIHFQGWNSSWDRCVSEEYVLKDTAENRQLQKDLAEKAQLQLGAYLYRRDKKRPRRLTHHLATTSSGGEHSNDSLIPLSEDGSCGSSAHMDMADDIQPSSSDSEFSTEEEVIPTLQLTAALKQLLELDRELVKNQGKLVRLPTQLNVVKLLQNYLFHFVDVQFGFNEKSKSKGRCYASHNDPDAKTLDAIQKNINSCWQMVDGLRIYFDYTCKNSLLYNEERAQYDLLIFKIEPMTINNASDKCIENEHHTIKSSHESSSSPSRSPTNCGAYLNLRSHTAATSTTTSAEIINANNSGSGVMTRRRKLRGNDGSDSKLNGFTTPSTSSASVNGFSKMSSNGNVSAWKLQQRQDIVKRLKSWKLVPDEILAQEPTLPCQVYGAIHLLRLLVALPNLLSSSSIPENKMKLILTHLDFFVEYMDEHKEWFGEMHYVDSSRLV